MFVIEVFLHLSRKFFIQFFDTPRAVEEVYTAIFQVRCRVIFLDICRSMTANKISRAYEIGRMNRFVTKTEMGLGKATGLHGVISKVCLCVFISIETDNGDGVLIGTDCTIAATTPDFCRNLARIIDVEFFCRQGCKCNIIDDADSEVVLRCILIEVFVYSSNLARSCIFGGQTIAATYDGDIRTAGLDKCRLNIEVQRFTNGTRFFRAVHNSDFLNRCRDSIDKMFNRERTIEMNLDHADFFAMGIEVIDSITDGFSSRTHDDDQFFCIFSTIVVEEFVVTAGQFVDFVHVVLNDIRNGCDFFVGAFFCLEEDIRIDSRATGVRMFRVQAVLTESCQLFIINEFCKIIIIKGFDTLHFVGCTEPVEYMHESIAAANSRQMGYAAEIHSFLR